MSWQCIIYHWCWCGVAMVVPKISGLFDIGILVLLLMIPTFEECVNRFSENLRSKLVRIIAWIKAHTLVNGV